MIVRSSYSRFSLVFINNSSIDAFSSSWVTCFLNKFLPLSICEYLNSQHVTALSDPSPRFALRRCATRVLSSQPSLLISSSRTYVSFSSPSVRIPRNTLLRSQLRWATTDNVPISTEAAPAEAAEETQAAAVEGAPSDSAPAIAETANATEATEEALPAAEINEKLTKQDPAYVELKPQDGNLFSRKPTIYIGNLFFDVTETDLVKEFARFGTVTKCRIVRDSRGLSKGLVLRAD